MRALAVFAVLAVLAVGRADADLNPWSVDVGYRGVGSFATAGHDAPSTYAQALVSRIENTTGRWFVGAVLAFPLPGAVGQSECSIAGGIHHVLRQGLCSRGDSTQLFCGNSLVMDYALEAGVASLLDLGAAMHDTDLEYYGPVIRPRVTARMLWPTRGGNQVGLVATAGLASVFGITGIQSMTDEPGHTTFRLEPSLEVSGVIRF